MRVLFFILMLLAPACHREDYTMVCCQHYNGKPSGYIYTNPVDYEEAVRRAFGVDMEGELDYDSAHVMFIHCKKF